MLCHQQDNLGIEKLESESPRSGDNRYKRSRYWGAGGRGRLNDGFDAVFAGIALLAFHSRAAFIGFAPTWL